MSRTYEVETTPEADLDLDDIADWYDERHPAGADRFFSDFQTAVQVLRTFPNAGRRRPDLHHGLRSYVVHQYLVFYVVDDDRKVVVIERVLHGAMDVRKTSRAPSDGSVLSQALVQQIAIPVNETGLPSAGNPNIRQPSC